MRARLLRGRERGQILMMSALLLPILLGMTAMAVDLGGYAVERRDLQNAVDSIALAAAQELPDTVAATTVAHEWAENNGYDADEVDLHFTVVGGGNSYPRVRATIEQSHEFAFVRVLGLENKNVSASATGIKASYGGSSGIVPWSVTQDTVDAAGNGDQVTMKYDADGGDLGNFGAIRIDGSGANTYNTSVKYGSTTVGCAVSAANCVAGACPGTYPSTCAETAPECDGPECTPETGNLIGATRTGVDYRMNNTPSACDSFAETFSGPDQDGKYNLEPECNPWLPGYTGTSTRVIIIPVVDTFGTGASDPTTIQRFALIYLEGYDNGKCQGSSCEINGRFVRADVTTRALAGAYDEEASVHFARLLE